MLDSFSNFIHHRNRPLQVPLRGILKAGGLVFVLKATAGQNARWLKVRARPDACSRRVTSSRVMCAAKHAASRLRLRLRPDTPQRWPLALVVPHRAPRFTRAGPFRTGLLILPCSVDSVLFY
jgi:hypothetical protein